MSKKAAVSLPERKTFPVPLGDRGSTTSNIGEQRLLRFDSIRRRRKRNPFCDERRNNFPDINDVFTSTPISSSGVICGDTGLRDYGGNKFYDDDDVVDEECCQHSDIDGSSVLNMSIGARAALNEHARYVAKFGIDGEINVEKEMNNNSNTSTDEINSEICTNVLLDDQWERMLNLSRVASSIGGSESEGIPSPPNSTTINLFFESSSGGKSEFGESSSIEVMTDVSHDFFNSSHVNLLITPERNRNRRAEMVITRDRVGAEDISLESQFGSSFRVYEHQSDKEDSFLELHHGQHRQRNDKDVQSSSFNLGDISRISNNTLSDTNCTIDASFQNDHKQEKRISVDANNTNDDGDDFVFTTMFGTASPSIILDDSLLSLPTATALARSSPGSDPEPKYPPRSSVASQDSAKEEGSSPGKSTHSPSSIQSALSAFIEEAYTFAKQVVSDVEISMEGIESLPAQFFRGIDIGHSNAPSPISQVFSSPSTSQKEDSTRKQRSFGKSLAVDINSSSSIDTNAHKTTDSFTSPVEGDALQIHLTGRKRYRTVVPRRVYLDLPTQQYNEEQDSFIAVQSNPETTRVGISLFESFEEDATSKTY